MNQQRPERLKRKVQKTVRMEQEWVSRIVRVGNLKRRDFSWVVRECVEAHLPKLEKENSK